MVVYPEYNDNFYLSLRNIPKVEGALLSDIHTYGIVNADVMVFTEVLQKIFTDADVEA